MSIHIKTFFDAQTSTFTHVVHDKCCGKAVVIDSVLNYNANSGHLDTQSADEVIAYIRQHDLTVEWLLETHIHADHLTAAFYLKNIVGGKIALGSRIKEVLNFWVPVFNTFQDTPLDASQFDHLFEDGEIFHVGDVEVKAMHTPGHTPACVSYLIEDALFVGDTIFMPDLGTARTDFPGGSASELYASIQKIFDLPPTTRLFMCHDYPPKHRELSWSSTVEEQKTGNILVHQGITKEEYVRKRTERDVGKDAPILLLPSIQMNLRAGALSSAEDNNVSYLKIPINKI